MKWYDMHDFEKMQVYLWLNLFRTDTGMISHAGSPVMLMKNRPAFSIWGNALFHGVQWCHNIKQENYIWVIGNIENIILFDIM